MTYAQIYDIVQFVITFVIASSVILYIADKWVHGEWPWQKK